MRCLWRIEVDGDILSTAKGFDGTFVGVWLASDRIATKGEARLLAEEFAGFVDGCHDDPVSATAKT